MGINATLYVIVGILSTALAQILLKNAGTHEVLCLKWVIFLLLSLLTYAVSFLSYYMALIYFDISKIQPIMMASIASIIALYGFAAGESFNSLRLAGIMLAVISVVLISKS